ncbi:MAG: aminotransferase class I/II-fold pyridoxal phosphate-dependent enzyme [Acidilobaceae archaeon]
MSFASIIEELMGFKYVIPVHQGRAAEHIISKVLVKQGSIVPMNYHFTTTKAHIELAGGEIVEIPVKEALDRRSMYPFKGNIDIEKLEDILRRSSGRVAFVRIEAVANLLGGQPVSMRNIREVRELCDKYNVPLILDASMIDWNVYYIKERARLRV